MEELVAQRRRQHLEQEIQQQPYDYDHWFDLIALDEQSADRDVMKIRETYERAILTSQPLSKEKDHWRRYIYLWLNYAAFEELQQHTTNYGQED